MQKTATLISSLLLLILMVNCTGNQQSPIAAPDAIADNVAAFGAPEADTVIVVAQGGPMPVLAADELLDVFSWVNFDETLLVNVHQAQTKDPTAFTESEITFEEAKSADSQSIAWLAEVVQHYKNAGKQVYVVGISFGAFVVQELLAEQGNVADGYAIVVGRLDMPDAVWQEFAEGRMVGFEDGVDVVPFSADEAGMGGDGDFTDANMAKLAAGLGHNRYTERLADLDMSNVAYAYGTVDEQVGRLTQAELTFLDEHHATVLEHDGDHGDTIDAMTQSAIEHLTK